MVTVADVLWQMLLLKVKLGHSDPNVDQVAWKTGLTLPVFPIRAAPMLPVFVCPIMASSCTNYLFGASNQKSHLQPASCVCLSPSEHHRQLIQLLPETGELSAATRVLTPSAETQVRDGTSPRPPWPLPALRPLLLGPGEIKHVWLYHTAVTRAEGQVLFPKWF